MKNNIFNGKHIACLMLTILLLVLYACGSETNQVEIAKFVFASGKELICVGDDASTLETKLGKPEKYFEAESCAFAGLDKTFTYKGFVVSSSPDDKKVDRIADIYFSDASVKTIEGFGIGDSAEKLEEVYGTAESKNASSITFVKEGVALQFIIVNNTIQGVEYFAW